MSREKSSEESFKSRVEKLGIPLENIIVIGSGVLDVLGIRTAGDVDLALTSEEFEQQRGSGKWQVHAIDANNDRRDFLSGDNVELFQGWRSLVPETDGYYDDLLPLSEVIDGLRCIKLSEIKRWKQQMGREKDLRDVQLIEEYEAGYRR